MVRRRNGHGSNLDCEHKKRYRQQQRKWSSVGLAFSPVSQRDNSKRKWNVRKLDPEALRASLARSCSTLQNIPTPDTCSETERTVLNMMKEISAACNASMPQLKNRSFHRPAYWWSTDIAELRKICH
ncbi:Protein of unknown function [Cotesia congregata]|uniref:Uncharacterized protein n=1 Tax=Cotesia congregata TaxID=51543 RepID=A0A8J2MPF2_COTCN|nr:Protein of unknown function [Cotesia congregata]